MKAVVCTRYGPPETLAVAEVPEPTPGPGQVLIRVKACGVNFPDTLIIQGKYQFRPPPPFSPGSDVAGVVAVVGEGVRHVQAGDAVVGLTTWGGYAEAVVVPAAQCFPKPPQMGFVDAAAFMMAYGTSYHALKDRAQLQPGETLLVLGAAGGVGLAAVELGRQMGARVIAAASSLEKLDRCRSYGAEETILYTEEDLKACVKDLTGGRGADVVYDPVGGAYAEAALRATAWKGRFLVVGFASGEIPSIPLNLPLLKGCAVMGVFWGAFAQKEGAKSLSNLQTLIQWYGEGKIKPHLHGVYPMADAPRALRQVMDREVQGKVVLVND